MYARIIRAQIPPENFDQALAATKERNVPMVTQFPGFKASTWRVMTRSTFVGRPAPTLRHWP